MLDVPFATAFTAGMVATVNPCGFAMLPAYLSFFIKGGTTEGGTPRANPVVRALLITAAMTAGFMSGDTISDPPAAFTAAT